MTFHIEVHVSEAGPDKWLAATAASPFFCFEANTREAVLNLAQKAVKFYAGHLDRINQAQADRERAIQSPRLKPSDRELLYA